MMSNTIEQWKWPAVTWRSCKCGMRHSSRVIPRAFMDQDWQLPTHPDRKKGGVIMIRPDYTVLVTQSYGLRYGFPKGEWDPGETVAQTASREFLEETGIAVSEEDLGRCLRLRYSAGKVEHVYFLVVVPVDFDPVLDPLDDVETTSIGWTHIKMVEGYMFSKVAKWAAGKIEDMHAEIHRRPIEFPSIISMPPCKNGGFSKPREGRTDGKVRYRTIQKSA